MGTNNDVEGWHCRLNDAAGTTRPSFYVSLPLLHKSPKLCDARWNWWKMANWLGTSAPPTAKSRAKYSSCGTNMSRETSQPSSSWRLAHIWQVQPSDLHATSAFPGTYGFPAKFSPHPLPFQGPSGSRLRSPTSPPLPHPHPHRLSL